MSGFDIAVLLVVGISAVIGFRRGFSQELLVIGAWALTILAIRLFEGPLAQRLSGPVGTESGAHILAFAILALVPYVGGRMLAARFGGAVRGSFVGPFDRALGSGFGALRGLIVVVLLFALVMLVYDMIWGSAGRPKWLRQSHSYTLVNSSSAALVDQLAERRAEAAASDNADEGADGAAVDTDEETNGGGAKKGTGAKPPASKKTQSDALDESLSSAALDQFDKMTRGK